MVGQLLKQEARGVQSGYSAIRVRPNPLSRHKVRPAPAIFSAAGLRQALANHFTTLATLTRDVLATERPD